MCLPRSDAPYTGLGAKVEAGVLPEQAWQKNNSMLASQEPLLFEKSESLCELPEIQYFVRVMLNPEASPPFNISCGYRQRKTFCSKAVVCGLGIRTGAHRQGKRKEDASHHRAFVIAKLTRGSRQRDREG